MKNWNRAKLNAGIKVKKTIIHRTKMSNKGLDNKYNKKMARGSLRNVYL